MLSYFYACMRFEQLGSINPQSTAPLLFIIIHTISYLLTACNFPSVRRGVEVIKITINQLRQYRHTKANILLLEQELDELILRSSAHDGAGRSNAVSDSVAQIVLQREKMRKRINLLTAQKNAVEAYLTGCDDYFAVLLRWHYIEGKTWANIAMIIGGGNTEEAIKKSCHRYVNRNP